MIHCKKHIIAVSMTLMLPLWGWSEVPVQDDSENFAMLEEQQVAVAHSKYNNARNDYYSGSNASADDSAPLVHEDQSSNANSTINDNAKLIETMLALQKEVQELRGQLEVQAHDLKLLQQQQMAFYKDLDARIGNPNPNPKTTTSSLNRNSQAKIPATKPIAAIPVKSKTKVVAQPFIATSRANPADEQISYMAAYELVKEKQNDKAIKAMQIFVQKYPKGSYTANAQYWLGELHMVKKEYVKAIGHFAVVLNEYPSSSKSAPSLLKMGYAYSETGNKLEAIKRLQEVVTRYPDTSSAQLAQSKLGYLNAL